MAPVKISLPQRLEFGQEGDPEERWKLFKQRWTNYTVIAKLETSKKKPIFLHCLADDALKALSSFQLVEDATVEQIIAEFDRYIIGEINIAYERYCFNKKHQRGEENFEQFFADLKILIKTCQFCETCRGSILRDKILFSIRVFGGSVHPLVFELQPLQHPIYCMLQ